MNQPITGTAADGRTMEFLRGLSAMLGLGLAFTGLLAALLVALAQ